MTLGILIVLAVVLGQLQSRSRANGSLDPASKLTQAVTAPATGLFNNVCSWTGATWASVANGPKNMNELQRLRQMESTYKLYSETTDSLQRELDQLRKLSEMPNFGRKRIATRIIGYFPTENKLTLMAGTAQGVGLGMPVVTAQGLLGIVQTVETNRCQILTVTSLDIRFGGLVMRDAGVAGIMKGLTPTRLRLDVLDSGKIEVGDAVVTSGFSDRIPRGIPVGTVAEVIPDPNYGTRQVFVAPSVQIGQSLEVYVLQ